MTPHGSGFSKKVRGDREEATLSKIRDRDKYKVI